MTTLISCCKIESSRIAVLSKNSVKSDISLVFCAEERDEEKYMWIIVYMTQHKERADKARELLEGHGLLVKVRSANHGEDTEDNCYEVLVPESESSEAHSIIIDEGF